MASASRLQQNWRKMLWAHILESLLLLSLTILILQLAWPTLVAYWNRPQPGKIAKQTLLEEVAGGQRRIDYLVYLPSNYRTREKWPLVIFLHGAGSRGKGIERLRQIAPIDMAVRDRFQFLLAAPLCPADRDWRSEQVIPLLDEIDKRFSVDRHQVYLTGNSMGGFGTWLIGAEHPERFAALLPIAGGGNPNMATQYGSLPIHAFHGKQDEVVPVTETEAMIKAIQEAGGNPRMKLFDNSGHAIARQVYSDAEVWKWLLAQTHSEKRQE